MSGCKKCGSYNTHGPIYHDGSTPPYPGYTVGGGGECLVYRCGNCGFRWTKPCADAKKNPTENLISQEVKEQDDK